MSGPDAKAETAARLFREEKPMNRLWIPISRALIMLSLPWGAAPGFAQPPPNDLVPFKLSYTIQNQAFPIATDPPIVSFPSTVTGQSDLFGAFTGAALSTQHLGADGKPLFATVVGEWTMASGDALSVEIPAIVGLPQPTPGGPLAEGVLIITNGKGRFLGARGSGFLKVVLQMDPVTRQGTVILSAEGLITRPKP
jgi:hypothetical protein